jgi:hypothetical protein
MEVTTMQQGPVPKKTRETHEVPHRREVGGKETRHDDTTTQQ